MTHVRIIPDNEATGTVAEDYRFVVDSYSRAVFDGNPVPVPEVYSVSSLVPSYLHFTAFQNQLLTEAGQHYCESDATVPRLLVLFATARFSACFH